jgi:hypothetical protein
MVGHLVISWDSSGCWIFRVAQNDRSRRVTLSEIRRKNCHSVPVGRMGLKPDRQKPPFRKSGGCRFWSGLHPSVTRLPDRRDGSRSDCLTDGFAPASRSAWIKSHSLPGSFRTSAMVSTTLPEVDRKAPRGEQGVECSVRRRRTFLVECVSMSSVGVGSGVRCQEFVPAPPFEVAAKEDS